jgi:hypothetical protein
LEHLSLTGRELTVTIARYFLHFKERFQVIPPQFPPHLLLKVQQRWMLKEKDGKGAFDRVQQMVLSVVAAPPLIRQFFPRLLQIGPQLPKYSSSHASLWRVFS